MALRRIIDRLRRAEAPGVARWRGGRGPAFADPVVAYALGRELVDALLAGRTADARHLLADHGRDPVVATVVVDGLGADRHRGAPAPGGEQWARVGAEADDQRAVVLGVAASLAQAERHGTTSLTVRDLADASDRQGVSVGPPSPSSSPAGPDSPALRAGRGPVRGRAPQRRAAGPARPRRRPVDDPGRGRAPRRPGRGPRRRGPGPRGRGRGRGRRGSRRPAARRPRPTSTAGWRWPASSWPATTPLHAPRARRCRIRCSRPHRCTRAGKGTTPGGSSSGSGPTASVPLAVHAELGPPGPPVDRGVPQRSASTAVLHPPLVLDEPLARAYLTYAQARDHVASTCGTRPGPGPRASSIIWPSSAHGGRFRRGRQRPRHRHRHAAWTRTRPGPSPVDQRLDRQNGLWRQVTRLAIERLPTPARGWPIRWSPGRWTASWPRPTTS